MLTFQNIYTEAQAQVQDIDSTSASPESSLTLIKRAVNQGMKKFGAILNREWRITYKTFNIVAAQQYYQMPEDAIRIKSLKVLSATGSTLVYPLTEITDEDVWNDLNLRSQSSAYPRYFFVRGSDEYGIWPIPSGAITSGGTIGYERRMRDMTADDYSDGSVAMTYGSPTVTGTGTVFTQNMVGRYLFVNDGSADGMAYKIQSYSSTTVITLENNYGGTSGGTQAYYIGEVPDIPEEFHEALIDYACYRYYRRRRDKQAADDMLASFKDALAECQADYSSKTSSQYMRRPHIRYGYSQFSNVNRSITP